MAKLLSVIKKSCILCPFDLNPATLQISAVENKIIILIIRYIDLV